MQKFKEIEPNDNFWPQTNGERPEKDLFSDE